MVHTHIMPKTFQISFDREADGRWIASIFGLRGAHAYGATKSEATEKVKELALWSLVEGMPLRRIPEQISFVLRAAA
jgi:predicted RNase H-like HicB family nuclease